MIPAPSDTEFFTPWEKVWSLSEFPAWLIWHPEIWCAGADSSSFRHKVLSSRRLDKTFYLGHSDSLKFWRRNFSDIDFKPGWFDTLLFDVQELNDSSWVRYWSPWVPRSWGPGHFNQTWASNPQPLPSVLKGAGHSTGGGISRPGWVHDFGKEGSPDPHQGQN